MAYTETDRDSLRAFGRHLAQLRHAAGLSQMQLALKADLDRTYVASVEVGRRNLSLLNILKLASALQVEPRDLLQWQKDQ